MTGLISRCLPLDNPASPASPGNGLSVETQAHASRVQRLMLSLVPHCDMGEELIKGVARGVAPDSKKGRDAATR